MTHSASVLSLKSEFNDFLFATIGEDGHGMQLSVLSALARLDVDPWQEAVKLAQLSAEAATQRLSSLIAALPEGQLNNLDIRMVAARLIARLPRQVRSAIPSRETLLGSRPASNPRAVIYAIVMALVLGAQCVLASRLPSAQVDPKSTRAASTAPAPKVEMAP
jgi:hypothetical protein